MSHRKRKRLLKAAFRSWTGFPALYHSITCLVKIQNDFLSNLNIKKHIFIVKTIVLSTLIYIFNDKKSKSFSGWEGKKVLKNNVKQLENSIVVLIGQKTPIEHVEFSGPHRLWKYLSDVCGFSRQDASL